MIINLKHNCLSLKFRCYSSFIPSCLPSQKDVYLQLRVGVISCQNPGALCGAAARGIGRAGVEEAEESTGEMTRNPLNKWPCSTLILWEYPPEGRGSCSVLQTQPCSLRQTPGFSPHVCLGRVRLPPSRGQWQFWVIAPWACVLQSFILHILHLN